MVVVHEVCSVAPLDRCNSLARLQANVPLVVEITLAHNVGTAATLVIAV